MLYVIATDDKGASCHFVEASSSLVLLELSKMKSKISVSPLYGVVVCLLIFGSSSGAQTVPAPVCTRTIVAKVAAFDQPLTFNRMGATAPEGAIFALLGDLVDNSARQSCDSGVSCSPGHVQLREGKRPRPIVLRMNVGDCLDVKFTNLLESGSSDGSSTRYAGFHPQGLELIDNPKPGISNNAAWTGANSGTLVPPGQQADYRYYAREEGTFFAYSQDDRVVGLLGAGLFGSINVEPEGAEYYRSQVTHEDLLAATTTVETLQKKTREFRISADSSSRTCAASIGGEVVDISMVLPGTETARQIKAVRTADGHLYTEDCHPIVDYGASRGDMPILNMLRPYPSVNPAPNTWELVYTDLTAIITGPGAGDFTSNSPSFAANYAYPNRRQPYREFSIHYHQPNVTQSFPQILGNNAPLGNMAGAGGDFFGINYGVAGIAPEVLANRLNLGAVKDCPECKFEEFFLSSWALGDPAMVVDNAVCPPATSGCNTKSATFVNYPDDPSNVYHSYLRDHVKFRIHNAANQAHVHHQHAHQWLHTPNDENSDYLDSQMIVPGASFTLEIAFGGSGNRNLTAGDSIFHCHFYTHFAEGMWSLWRVHDVFESGTLLEREVDKNSTCPLCAAKGARALPDGEITTGTPIPAIVPLPAIGMAPLPARVYLAENGRRVQVDPEITPAGPKYTNPGYPFFVPGLGGHRAPHPPMDFAWEEIQTGLAKESATKVRTPLDGGLPRHLVIEGSTVRESHTRWDFTKDFVRRYTPDPAKPLEVSSVGWLKAFQLPEEGTSVERAAMDQHSGPSIQTFQPNGDQGIFTENGNPPLSGAPFANPNVSFVAGNQRDQPTRRYKAAVFQTDAVLNKKGWHYPQQRMMSLWGDVQPTLKGTRPPQPFFFRGESGQTIEFWHTNLVPSYYELDDFQVRTPTDILGQHIHLVKFDVLASDGAANGFNYEDGTLSPDEVRDRIEAIQNKGGMYNFDPATQWINPNAQFKLTPKVPPVELGSAPPGQDWTGAQTTIQLWSSDPLENNAGFDRTLRTVFTHDHFGPSTHQQAGLYAGLLVEPKCSAWYDSETGQRMYDETARSDGGPTSWQAKIVVYNNVYNNCDTKIPGPVADSYREFALEFQDLQLAYLPTSPAVPTADIEKDAPLFCTKSNYSSQLVSGKPVPAGLATELCSNGITLRRDARASNTCTYSTADTANSVVCAAGKDWEIRDPFGNAQATCVGNSGQWDKYLVKASSKSCGTKFFQAVFTPDLPAGWADPQSAINAPNNAPNSGNSLKNQGPSPSLVSQGALQGGSDGTYSLNYRNEPLPLRVTPGTNPNATDLSYAFSSTVTRNDPVMNSQPILGGPIDAKSTSDPRQFTFPRTSLTPGMEPGDPFTPLLRAYEGDKVQIRTLVGAHLQPHSFYVHGLNWYFEPEDPTSGSRSAQGMALSEHFEMIFHLPKTQPDANHFADYVYQASSGTSGTTNGAWGLLRAYDNSKTVEEDQLQPLPNNPDRNASGGTISCDSATGVDKVTVYATTAAQALPGGVLAYNSRGQTGAKQIQQIIDPNALLFFSEADYDPKLHKVKDPLRRIEPLILRVPAGEWLQVTLFNDFPAPAPPPAPPYPATSPFTPTLPAAPPFGTSQAGKINLATSTQVGLHPGLVSLDITQSDGTNAGFNPVQTAGPQNSQTYCWYAGNRTVEPDGKVKLTPVEFGSVGLVSSDPLLHPVKGLVGALVVEPAGSVVTETDKTSHASALVTSKLAGGAEFYEFVVILQDAVESCKQGPASCAAGNSIPVDSFGSINYRTEPQAYRYPVQNQTVQAEEAIAQRAVHNNVKIPNEAMMMAILKITAAPSLVGTASPDPAALFSNSVVNSDPQTPVFAAPAGAPVRLRMIHPGGDKPQVATLHSHVWQEEPYIPPAYNVPVSTVPAGNVIGLNYLSEWIGSRQISPNETFDFVIDSAGGRNKVPGDYLLNLVGQSGSNGAWALLRVTEK
jgi:hypothetical protein